MFAWQNRAWIAVMLMEIALTGPATAQLRVSYVDPLSSAFANHGDHGDHESRQFQSIVEDAIGNGGVVGQKIQIVPSDNQGSLTPTLASFKSMHAALI